MNFCWSDKYKINANELFYLLIPLKLCYEVLVVLWSKTRGKSMKLITPHLGCVLSEVSWQNNMGHCKVSDIRVQGNRCWNAMYVIKLSEPQRRTTLGYSCLYISIVNIISKSYLQILLKCCKILCHKFTLTEKKFKTALNFLADLAVSKLGYNLICNSC